MTFQEVKTTQVFVCSVWFGGFPPPPQFILKDLFTYAKIILDAQI